MLLESLLAGFINALVLSFIIRYAGQAAIEAALKKDRESQLETQQTRAKIDPAARASEERRGRIYQRMPQGQQSQ